MFALTKQVLQMYQRRRKTLPQVNCMEHYVIVCIDFQTLAYCLFMLNYSAILINFCRKSSLKKLTHSSKIVSINPNVDLVAL